MTHKLSVTSSNNAVPAGLVQDCMFKLRIMCFLSRTFPKELICFK